MTDLKKKQLHSERQGRNLGGSPGAREPLQYLTMVRP